ncbi:lycopene cyclase [Halobacteriales archaeon SW_10_68_16]|nr:MAG: lycopene cyclase [Halobacteriales archaeon SW_10_68_16]
MELTYLTFLAVFVLVPLSTLGVAAVVRPSRERPSLGVQVGGTVLLVVLALAYTTPWDNLLIAEGVWWYGEGRVVGRVWLAPVEEYLFIALQSVLVAVWTFRIGGSVDASVVGVALVFGPQSTFYLGAILAWAGPVLALQWAVGWRYLLSVRRRVAAGIVVPTAYLCGADLLAIRNGIWTISPDHTTGLALAGLPVEEATFFLLTSAFVVQGLVLLRWVMARWD